MNDTTRQILEQMATGRIPDVNPDTTDCTDALSRLAQYFAAIQRFTIALSIGDLSQSLEGVTGPVAGGLKSLQSGLRHLTWQAKQIAGGDFSQQIDFMGDFSTALNAMVKDLGEASSTREKMNLRLKKEMEELRWLTEALRESEERFRLIAENVRAVIWTCDVSMRRFTYISPFIANLQGLTVQEAMEEPFENAFTPESFAFIQEKLTGRSTLLESGLSKNYPDVIEIEQICRDGTIISVEMVISAITDHDGNIREYVGISRDITERKRTEEERVAMALQQEGVNLLQRSLLKPAPLEAKLAGITDGIVRYFNADFCRIWLIRPGDQCGQECIHAAVMNGQHVCRQQDKCLHLLAGSGRYTHIDGKEYRRLPFGCYRIGQIASGEAHKFLTNDVKNDPFIHDHKWAHKLGLISFAGYQLRIPEGEPIGVLALFSKNFLLPTEDAMLDGLSSAVALAVRQADAERALRENTVFINTLLNSLPPPVFYKDTNCRYIGFNKAYEEFIGKTRDQLLGKSVFDIAPRELAEIYHAKDLELLQDQGTQVYEAQVKDAQGSRHDVIFYKATFMDDGGRNLLGLIGTILDITERKRAEKELTFKNVILSTQQETSIDGILVLGESNTIISYNRRFADIWGIPHMLVETRNNVAVFRLMTKLVSDKKCFLGVIRHLYEHTKEKSREEVLLKDSRIIDCYSAPMWSFDERYLGRVWYFRDITEQKQMEESIYESRQLLSDIFDFLPDATFVIDNDQKVIAWNRAMEEMTGISKTEMLGKGDYEYSIPFYGERRPILIDLAFQPNPEREKLYASFQRDGDTLVGEVFVPRLRSDRAYLSATASVLRDSRGRIVAAISCIRNDTKRKETEDELRASQDQLALAMELARLVKWELDIATGIYTFNDQFYALYGTNAEREGGYLMPSDVYVREFVHPEDVDGVIKVIENALASKKPRKFVQLEHRIVGRNGVTRDIAVRSMALRDNNGNIIKLYGANQDVTEHKCLEKALIQQARTDHMTGVNNRGYFLELLDEEIERAHRYNRSVCVLMLDLDHFKSVNDTYGHAAGDEAIRTVISVIQLSGLRQSDFLGRIGGEEFAVGLPETDFQSAVNVAERVCSQLAVTPVSYESKSFSITVSIGVCEYRDGDSQETLLKRADQAMYQAKQTGRNRVCLVT